VSANTRWFWAVVLGQVVSLLAWAGWHEHVRSYAPVIRLKTVPVDPRDLLRGDYMILRYEISDVKPPVAPVAHGARESDFWVVLEPRDGFHVAVATSWDVPNVLPPQIAVKAWRGDRGVAYGIENFYVPEGKGTPRFKTIEVDAAVSPTNKLYLKRVLVDGRPYP
jgi:uncharacterized membrane-anchored protein